MPLIERFTPGGNLYADPNSTFAMLAQAFRRIAENRDERDNAQRTAWRNDDTEILTTATDRVNAVKADVISTAATDATTKANTARTNAVTEATTAAAADATTKADAARTDAYTYTDTTFLATPAGESSDAAIDAGVDRAVASGRVLGEVTDQAVAGHVGNDSSVTREQMRAAFVPWDSTTANVKNPQYGAKGDGTTDDSAAVSAAMATGKHVYFPPGVYVGTWNFDVAQPRIIGAGEGTTMIKINTGEYFIDANRIWHASHFEGIRFDGGAGAIRNRHTDGNVTTRHVVADCYFVNYTGAAISHESRDMPLWSIERNVFRGANDSTTIGVALNGLTDINRIQSNEFQRNRVHVKLGQGGNNAYVMNNDFIQYNSPTAGQGRAYLWVVPSQAAGNHGQGLVVADNKYGPENIGNDDFRVLYADEGPGTYFGDRLPNIAADSTGRISGHTFRGGLLMGSDAGAGVPFIHTTTRDIAGLMIDGLQVASTAPDMLLRVRTPGALYGRTVNNTVINVVRQGSLNGIRVTNQPGMLRVYDTAQAFAHDPTSPFMYTGGATGVGYVNLLTNKVTIGGFSIGSGASRTNITDALGGDDAIALAIPSGSISSPLVMSNLDPNQTTWVEFDVAAGDTDALTGLRVWLTNTGAASGQQGNHLDVTVTPTNRWVTYRYRLQVAAPNATVYLNVIRGTGATGTNVKIGRVRVYHGREPVITDLALPNASTTTTAPAAGAGAALPTAPAGYLSVSINGTRRRIAYY